MINHKEVVKRHNPVLTKVDVTSPITVGNGEFAFTADITGMQTLYQKYCDAYNPLCTMSQWGWHTTPVSPKRQRYTTSNLVMTEYQKGDRILTYASKEQSGNGKVYHWLRQNPHRLNLARIGFVCGKKKIDDSELTNCHQELHLYEGRLESEFCLRDSFCKVTTAVHSNADIVGFHVESEMIRKNSLKVQLTFPYGSPDISASDWTHPKRHESVLVQKDEGEWEILRTLDHDSYTVVIKGTGIEVIQSTRHNFYIQGMGTDTLEFSVEFLAVKDKDALVLPIERRKLKEVKGKDYKGCLNYSKGYWKKFWENGGIIDLSESTDPRWFELERRIILSLYLIAIQSAGSMPPQETGLTCNSWYGKFHLEMHFWHAACLPLFHHADLLQKSLHWYQDILEKAKANAQRNGYRGARWPKMVAYEGIDSPSSIATLLIWQQPHLLYFVELVYTSTNDLSFLKEYWQIVKETADFMVDFLDYDEQTKQYELNGPYIPAQERFDPETVKNAVFELEYWTYGLKLASRIGRRIGVMADQYEQIANHIVKPAVIDGVYPSHENCTDTFTNYNEDHPSMVGAYGVLPSDRIRPQLMEATLERVYQTWDFESMWGWDFAMLAMSEVRLGHPEQAIDILLKDTPKNSYVVSGNNYQKTRHDLPLYLPGNGSLLLCVAMMASGFGKSEDAPGFPKDGRWKIKTERVGRLPD